MNKRIYIILVFLLMVGCSSVKSVFDSTYLLWSSEKRAENVKTPPEFVVSFEEVHSLIDPLQKFGWYIYADSNSYFLVETQTLIPGFHVVIPPLITAVKSRVF